MPSISILTPQDAELLLRYFAGVASVLARRFELGFQPDEEHLTSLLCELLDDHGAALHSLQYTAAALNKDLEQAGSLLHASVSLRTTEYNKYQERHHTQADLGIVLDYRDHVNHSASFRKGILVQAKKLFPEDDEHYLLGSRYKSFDVAQHERMRKLEEYYFKRLAGIDQLEEKEREMRRRMHGMHGDCNDAFQYLLYNPPFRLLPKRDQERALHHQLSRESTSIFDYTHGLCLYESLRKPTGLKDTLETSALFVPLHTAHSMAQKAASTSRGKPPLASFDLAAVVESVDFRQRSFPWYLVFDFLGGNAGCDLPEFCSWLAALKPESRRILELAVLVTF